MILSPEEEEINARLRESGVPHTLRELRQNPALSPDCAPRLLELFRLPYPIYRRVALAEALFARKSNKEAKREAVDILLDVVRENAERYDAISGVVLNELADNVSANNVNDLGEMLLDKRFGPVRAGFAYGLKKIGNADAIEFLKKAAKDPGAAAYALDALAKLRVPETSEFCEVALANPETPFKDTIRTTLKKLKRRSEKIALSHLTEEAVPANFEEWSVNIDDSELRAFLRPIQKVVERDFGKKEIDEIRKTADDLELDDTVRFRFEIAFQGTQTSLWVELLRDDEAALSLYVFSTAEVIAQIERCSEPAA